jgi:predicted RecA/RadA family phage recombinase
MGFSLLRPAGAIKETASGAIASGAPGKTADGRANFLEGQQAAISGDAVSKRTEGFVLVPAASGTTFAKGADVIWDASAGLAVNPALTGIDGGADYFVGKCSRAKVSGELFVEVELNTRSLRPAVPQPFVCEFDCEDGQDETSSVKNEHVLVPAEFNRHGLLILAVYGVVTEVFAGDGEDQGVVTVRDASNNTLATLTTTDPVAPSEGVEEVLADAVGDVIVGTNKLIGATTGAAIKTVAAGQYIDAQVTQETAGTGKAGKMKVYVLCMPLV